MLFQITPVLYKAKLDAEMAEVQLAQLELANTKRVLDNKTVSANEVKLFEAKLAKAQAKAKLAQATWPLRQLGHRSTGFLARPPKAAGQPG